MFKTYKKSLVAAVIIVGLVGVQQPAYASMTAEKGAETNTPIKQNIQEKQQSPFYFWSWKKAQPITKPQNQVEVDTNAGNITDKTENPSQESAVNVLNAFEQEVFTLTNAERAKYGLPALQVDITLSKVAREKSNDMAKNRYFSHQSPTYGSPFDMMEQFGIQYRAAGENIARGQTTPSEVVNGWMNSEGHRANILSNKFTHIGVGYVENGNYWTQQFISY